MEGIRGTFFGESLNIILFFFNKIVPNTTLKSRFFKCFLTRSRKVQQNVLTYGRPVILHFSDETEFFHIHSLEEPHYSFLLVVKGEHI